MFNSDLKRPIIKVCGMKDTPLNEEVIQNNRIDWFGFIFFEGSARYTTSTLTTSNKGRVGVFVNTTVENVIQHIQEHQLTHVQLHGNESVEFCASLKNHTKVIKAFGIKDALDLEQLGPYLNVVDYFLLDTKTPLHGGSGQQFDWTVLSHYTYDKPFLLSGGIGPDDVERILEFQHEKCVGIDLNSRFESAPGIKNASLLSNFTQALNTSQIGLKKN